MTTFIILTIVLTLFGIGLLLAEMFLLPGFGIAGICGLASLVAAIVIAYVKLSTAWAWAGHVTLATCLVLCGIAVWIFLKSKAFPCKGWLVLPRRIARKSPTIWQGFFMILLPYII